MYLFDTDIITNIFKRRPSVVLLTRLANTPRTQQHISTVTVAEIVYGACKSGRADHHLQNLQQVLLPAVNLLGFDSKAAFVCGRIRAMLEKAGTPGKTGWMVCPSRATEVVELAIRFSSRQDFRQCHTVLISVVIPCWRASRKEHWK